MFGSSQDRARQLAGRRRKERISSNGSISTSRSISSSSHVSQQNLVVPAHVPITQPSAIIEEQSQTLKDQKILQAEYLSQVLYEDLEASVSIDPPLSRFGGSLRQSRYGSLEVPPEIARHLRNITAPAHNSRIPSPQVMHSEAPRGAASLTRSLVRSTSESHIRLQTTVCLRGGLGENLVKNVNKCQQHACSVLGESPKSKGLKPRKSRSQLNHTDKERRLLSRSFTLEFPWVAEVCSHPQWHAPISSGASFDAFIESLATTELERFRTLFGPSPTLLPASVATARRIFFMTLDPPQRQVFKNIITSKGMALLALLEGNVGNQYSPSTLIPKSNLKPIVMLEHLLEATEHPELLVRCRETSSTKERIPGSTPFIVEEKAEIDKSTEYRSHFGGGGGGGGSAGHGAARATLNKLFDKYREAKTTEHDTIGAEGTMQYFEDTGVNVEGLESLAVLEIVQAPTMGEMSREGFLNGWEERRCDTLEKQQAYIKTLKRELESNRDLFTRVYRYTFAVAKAPGQKAVPLDMAIAYWELLFSSPMSAVRWSSFNTPWLSWWTEFLTSSWKKSVNKDMWNETLKFAQLTLGDEDMKFWNEESSWPSVIDEFVEWVKNEKRKGSKEELMEDEY